MGEAYVSPAVAHMLAQGLTGLSVFLLIVVCLSRMPPRVRAHELLAHFQVHYMYAAVAGLIASFFMPDESRIIPIAACMAVLLISGCAVLCAITPARTYKRNDTQKPVVQGQSDTPASLFVAHANVQHINTDTGQLVNLLRRHAFDVVSLVEVTDAWQAALSHVRDIYPHQIFFVQAGRNGSAILSRHALDKIDNLDLADSGLPTPAAEIMLPNFRKVRVMSVHPPNPLDDWRLRDRMLSALARVCAQRPAAIPYVVMGDFNITPFACAYRALQTDGHMLDARRAPGRGYVRALAPSWPRQIPLVCRIPIDHVLVSDGVRVDAFGRLSRIGSDHTPVFARLSI